MSSKEIIKLVDQPELFWKGINDLKLAYKSCHYLFSQKQIEYRRERLSDEKCDFKDLSFILLDSGIPYYSFFGFATINKDKGRNYRVICSGELPSSSLESIAITNNQKKIIASELEKVFIDVDVIEYIELMQRSTFSITTEYLLRKPNSEIKSRFNCLIDLEKTENDLKIEIRRSYRSLINWGEKNLEFHLLDNDNLDESSYQKFLQFRELHYHCAGRRTRSQETWDIQYKCIEEGSIFAIFGYLNGEMVTGGLFYISDDYVYYAVSASARELFEKPLFHSIFWRAIQHSKDIGASKFDAGEIYLRCQADFLQKSEKELNIARFKSGFGGRIIPRLEVCTYRRLD